MKIIMTETFETFLSLTFPSWRREIPQPIVDTIDNIAENGSDVTIINICEAVIESLEQRFGKAENNSTKDDVYWPKAGKFYPICWQGKEEDLIGGYEILVEEKIELPKELRDAVWENIPFSFLPAPTNVVPQK